MKRREDTDLAKRLRLAMDAAKLTTEQAARRFEQAGAEPSSYHAVRQYTMGKQEPVPSWLRVAADVLGVRFYWLLDGKGPMRTGTREAIIEESGLSYLPESVQEELVTVGIEVALGYFGHIPKQEDDPEGRKAFFNDAARTAAFFAAYIRLPLESGFFMFKDMSDQEWEAHAERALRVARSFGASRVNELKRNDTLIDAVTALVRSERTDK